MGVRGNSNFSMNTTIKPFEQPHLRKAGPRRLRPPAMRLTRGGALSGDIATHYIIPHPAFDEAAARTAPVPTSCPRTAARHGAARRVHEEGG